MAMSNFIEIPRKRLRTDSGYCAGGGADSAVSGWLEEVTTAWRGMVVQVVSQEAERVRHTLPRPGRLPRPGPDWRYQMREIFDNMTQQMENINGEIRSMMEQKLQESERVFNANNKRAVKEEDLDEGYEMKMIKAEDSPVASEDEEENEDEEEEEDVFDDWDWSSSEWDEENKVKTVEDGPEGFQLKFYDQPRGAGVWSDFNYWQVDLTTPRWGEELTIQISREDNIALDHPEADTLLMKCMEEDSQAGFESLESFICSSSFHSSSRSRKLRKRMRISHSPSGLDVQMVMKGSWKMSE